MIYLLFGMSGLFVGLGWLVTEKNAKYLLAGYNTMSEIDRSRFDLKSYLRFFRRFHLFLGVSFLLVGLCLHYFSRASVTGTFISVYPILAYIYFIWRGSRYQIKLPGQSHSTKKWNKIGIYILVITLLGVAALTYYGFKNDPLLITSQGIELKGMYGEHIPSTEIESIQMVDHLPSIRFKSNGFALGTIYKGYFQTKEGERVKLMINNLQNEYLLILKKDGRKIYYSSRENTLPEQLDQIRNQLPQINVL